MAATRPVLVGGPYYEDLFVGQRFTESPALTLSEGQAAVHQAVLGDRLRLALDAHLAAAVLGPGPALAHPGLVCDVAIGQSTVVTQRVVANLFYRGLTLLAAPRIGDTLRTVTEVVALRDNSPKPGRQPTGLALLRMQTVDQSDQPVLDFHRCAMLPMRFEAASPGHKDDFDDVTEELRREDLVRGIQAIDLGRYRDLVPGDHGTGLAVGTRYELEAGETVSGAPELVRSTLNLAAAHTDASTTGRGARLVYGGHTIGIALAHVTRALPNLVTVAGWRACDHLGPVFEGDILRSAVTIVGLDNVRDAVLVDLHVGTSATRGLEGSPVPVLDWRLVAVAAG
jgi:acyl dehydratase